MKEQIDIIRDLLVEFDEMGFVPSVPTPNNEVYAIKWRDEITKALVDCFKQEEGEWVDADPNGSLYRFTCSLCRKTKLGKGTPYCPNCGAHMKGGAE